MFRKIFIFLSVFFVILMITIFCIYFFNQSSSQEIIHNENISLPLPNTSKQSDNNIISAICPHHLAAKPMIKDFYQQLAQAGQPQTIILLSPDHFNYYLLAGNKNLILPSQNHPKFYGLEIDTNLLKLFNTDQYTLNSSYLIDHGITNHLYFIKQYFPNAKVLPVIIPQQADNKKIDHFTRLISKQAPENTLVVASVDFSHYLPVSVAEFHDTKSISTLIDFDQQDFPELEVDCWQCLYSARLFARFRQSEDYSFLDHKNVSNFLEIYDPEYTTSYLTLLFKKGDMMKNNYKAKTVLFIGDMMLDRGVEALMKKNSWNYPFLQVDKFFKGIDYIAANLEGPIMNNPPYNGPTSLQFAFDAKVIPVLKENNLNLVSLSNNHTLNMGKSGLAETRQLLTANQINFTGDPIDCEKEFAHIDDDFVFLGINKTYSANCSDQKISQVIAELNQENPDKMIIISIHWGNEYKKVHNNHQEKLAQAMIDAGADLIIGHHPHVVQDIAIYKNKLIFYSLGNFIFDQYFSQNTQDGLAIGFEKYEDKFVYRIFPIQSNFSQPRLMEQDNARLFLQKLAERSSLELQEMIISGIIELTND